MNLSKLEVLILTALPFISFQNDSKFSQRTFDILIDSFEAKSFFKEISDIVNLNLEEIFNELLKNQYTIQTIQYWKKKLEQFDKKIVEKFLITKLLEIHAFSSKFIPNEINKYITLDNSRKKCYQTPKKTIIKNINIAFVIPVLLKNDFSLKKLLSLIKSINEQNFNNYQIILIIDTKKVIYDLKDFKNVIIIENIKRLGPAYSRNLGVKVAREFGNEYIVFIDYDVKLPFNWINQLVYIIKRDQPLIFTGRILSLNNTWWDYYHDINGTLNGRMFEKDNNLLFATTSALGVNINIFDHVMFKEDIFLNAAGEDIDFCLEVMKLGIIIKKYDELNVYHDYGYTGFMKEDLKIFFERYRRYGEVEPVIQSIYPEYYDLLSKTSEISNILTR